MKNRTKDGLASYVDARDRAYLDQDEVAWPDYIGPAVLVVSVAPGLRSEISSFILTVGLLIASALILFRIKPLTRWKALVAFLLIIPSITLLLPEDAVAISPRVLTLTILGILAAIAAIVGYAAAGIERRQRLRWRIMFGCPILIAAVYVLSHPPFTSLR